MRVLDRSDPRWVALLLVPVLLLAGAAAQPPPEAAEPRTVAADVVAPVPLPDAPAGPEADEPVTAAAVVAVPAAGPLPRRLARASRGEELRTAPRGVQARGERALASLDYDWRALGYGVRFLPYRGGELGRTDRPARLVTVYVKPGQSELSLRATVAHELGHALDFEHGDSARRDAYREVRGLPSSTPWFPCDGCDDFRSPAGDFAEVFAAWLVGPGDFRSRLAGPPTAEQLRRLAPLFRVPAREPEAAAAPAPEPTATRPPERGLAALLGPAPSPSPR